jgi:hypothetical protein
MNDKKAILKISGFNYLNNNNYLEPAKKRTYTYILYIATSTEGSYGEQWI